MQAHVAIGSDHAGFELKGFIKEHLASKGFAVSDFGTHSTESMDYPDVAHVVADAVAGGEVEFGVLMCGSGNGVNVAANRHPGVRSALAWRPEIAALAKQHNKANILALPARFVSVDEAKAIVDAYLAAAFEEGRHQRRVEKIECA